MGCGGGGGEGCCLTVDLVEISASVAGGGR
jgi:hypothetical protein